MKKLMLLAIAIVIGAGIIQAQEKVKEKKDMKANKTSMKDMLYKSSYSSDFRMGNPAYVTKVMESWKDWEDNQLERHDYFSDTIKGYFADGSMVKGKDQFLAEGKKFRSGISSVKSTIHAIIPLYSIDRKEDVVCVWGTEENTMPDGTKVTNELHEVWFFNKDGKMTMLRQWDAKPNPN